MNIGLFTDTYYPELNGVANSVYLLKKELEKKGHNVYVITTKTPDAPANEKDVFRVPSKACSFVPERRIGLFYHPRIAMKIHKMKLDIIHTNTEFAIGMFGRIMAHELFVPVVHTYHTIYEDYTHYIKKYISSEKRAKAFVKMFSKFSVRGAEELIVPTEKVATLMRHYGVKPDIRTTANALGCGVPDRAFRMTEKVGSHSLTSGDHGTTSGGNPLAAAAINGVLDLFEENHIIDNVKEVGAYLAQKLDELVDKYDCIQERRGLGLMQGLVFDKPVGDIITKALDKGLILINAGTNIIRFVPPLVITKQHVDDMCVILKECLEE